MTNAKMRFKPDAFADKLDVKSYHNTGQKMDVLIGTGSRQRKPEMRQEHGDGPGMTKALAESWEAMEASIKDLEAENAALKALLDSASSGR